VRHPKAWSGLLIALAAVCAVTAGCPGTGDTSDRSVVVSLEAAPGAASGACGAPANRTVLIEQVLQLVNEERASRGLDAVVLNPILTQMAESYCCEMIEQGFFDHVNPATGEGPGERAYKAGYVFLAVGENLAAGQESPRQAVTEWMASPEHREILLGVQWREVGVGVAVGGQYGVYWVLEFGNPP